MIITSWSTDSSFLCSSSCSGSLSFCFIVLFFDFCEISINNKVYIIRFI